MNMFRILQKHQKSFKKDRLKTGAGVADKVLSIYTLIASEPEKKMIMFKTRKSDKINLRIVCTAHVHVQIIKKNTRTV